MTTSRNRPSFGQLLFMCAQRFDDAAQAEVRLARPALMRLLPFLDTQGVRPTDLARIAGVSKQAIGVSLRALEDLGLVSFVDDPADSRAFQVKLTAKGVTGAANYLSLLSSLESELAKKVGRKSVDDMTNALVQMFEVVDGWSKDGAPTSKASKKKKA